MHLEQRKTTKKGSHSAPEKILLAIENRKETKITMKWKDRRQMDMQKTRAWPLHNIQRKANRVDDMLDGELQLYIARKLFNKTAGDSLPFVSLCPRGRKKSGVFVASFCRLLPLASNIQKIQKYKIVSPTIDIEWS